MKREHFEWLWKHCQPDGVGFVIDPAWLGIETELRDSWVATGILSNEHDVKVKARDENIKGLLYVHNRIWQGYFVETETSLWLRRMLEHDNPDPFGWAYTDYKEVSLNVFDVDRENLIRAAAIRWGITPYFWEIPPCGYLFGYKEGKHHVIVLAGKLDRLLLPNVAIETRENLGLEAERAKSQLTHVLQPGSTSLTYMELLRLFKRNIVFAGMQDFLTDDGDPVWEFEYMEDDEIDNSPSLFVRDEATGYWKYKN